MTISEMKAGIRSRPGGPEALTRATRPLPEARPNQVLVQVAFAGINGHEVGERTSGSRAAVTSGKS
jgi:NADPH:quinone reductase-like Zn-dependent oxidoreductase